MEYGKGVCKIKTVCLIYIYSMDMLIKKKSHLIEGIDINKNLILHFSSFINFGFAMCLHCSQVTVIGDGLG